MRLSWREAAAADVELLAEWNRQLIRDEGHRNPMTVAELAERMRQWLATEYRAVIFADGDPVAYALYKPGESSIHLRQFFVRRERRRQGIGRAAIAVLQRAIWPADARLTVDVLCRNEAGTAFWHGVGYRDYCLTLEITPKPLEPHANDQ